MKKYLLAVLLLASFQSFGQFLNYTNINGRYKWIAGKFDSTFTIPSGTTPSLRVGGGTGPGALFYSTTDSTVYQYTGTQWTRLRGSDTAHVISAYVRNTTASAMTPGQVVYINGSTGTTPTIALAVNKQDSTSAMTFGFVRGNIPVNGFGYITTFGPLEGVNTNAYDEGEVIYLDSIPGQFTHDKPQAPYHMVTLGYIIKKSGGNGTIYAKVQNGYELDELHNVRITEPVLNKSVIIYDSVRRLWVDTTVSAAGLGLGGSGTTNYVSKWTSSTALGNSQIFDNGTSVGIGTATPSASYILDINGAARVQNNSGLSLLIGSTSASSTTTPAVISLGGTIATNTAGSPNNIKLRIYDNGTSSSYAGVGYVSGRMEIGANDDIFFYTGGASRTTRLNIFSATGNVGVNVGSTDSGEKFQVVGTSKFTLDANINGLTVGKGGGNVSDNTAFGVEAINATATGTSNTAIGWRSGRAITTGNFNTLLGSGTLQNGTTAGGNTAIGYNALNTATSGSENIAVGQNSLRLLTTGYWNVAVGRQAGNDVTTGYQNVFIGDNTGRGITTGNSNTIIGAGITGLSSSLSNTIILADGQGNQRLYINSSGNVGIGSTNPASKLTLNQTATGDQKISFTLTGTEYGYFAVNTASGRVNLGSDSYSTRYFGTSHIFNNTVQITTSTFTGQNPKFDIGGGFGSMYVNWDSPSFNIESSSNTAYSMRFNTGGSERMRIFGATGNISINSTTDAGYKLDVNGTARVSDVFHANGSAIGFGAVRVKETSGGYGVVVHPNASTSTYTQYNASSITFWNGSVASTISQISGSLYNDVNSANAIYNRFSNNHVFTITSSGASVGASSLNASAVLEATSTTKGFLPPRMTGAQAEAIGTPAAGLLVYANNGNGTTITSTGWWGYDGTNWVKLN